MQCSSIGVYGAQLVHENMLRMHHYKKVRDGASLKLVKQPRCTVQNFSSPNASLTNRLCIFLKVTVMHNRGEQEAEYKIDSGRSLPISTGVGTEQESIFLLLRPTVVNLL